jgi:hypothetical protein
MLTNFFKNKNKLYLKLIALTAIFIGISIYYILRSLNKKSMAYRYALVESNNKIFKVNKNYSPSQKQEAADMLAKIHMNVQTLLEILQKKLSVNTSFTEGINRLIKKYPTHQSIKIDELIMLQPPQIQPIAFNRNKGENIFICMYEEPASPIANYNSLFHVVLHELAHVMEKEYSTLNTAGPGNVHSGTFMKYEAFLQNLAHNHNLYNKNIPSDKQIVCGQRIFL